MFKGLGSGISATVVMHKMDALISCLDPLRGSTVVWKADCRNGLYIAVAK